MKPDLERRALDIVLMLADAETSQRPELFEKLCGDDPALQSAVELLRASMEAVKDGRFLERPILKMLTSAGLHSANSVKDSNVAPARISTEPVGALSTNGSPEARQRPPQAASTSRIQ